MRIVHYLSSVTRSAGGLYYSVSGLSKAQAAMGHEVAVVGGADQYLDEDSAIWSGVTLCTHPVKSNGYGLSLRVPTIIRSLSPDILHIHGIWSAATIYGALAARRGVATVISPRGMLDPWILKRRALVKSAHSLLFERPLLRGGLAHALNDSERDSIARFMGEEGVRTAVVPNGVQLLPIDPDRCRSGAVYLGRLHEKKQVLQLISAWGNNDSLRDMPLKVAGWGAADYEREVRQACSDKANVEFIGPVYGEEKQKLLGDAAFFVLPSLSEGLPMAVLEAMSSGAIPIITAECNLPDLFLEGSAIQIRSDFQDFSQVVEAIAGMNTEQLAVFRSKVNVSIQRFGWPHIASLMLDQYRSFLSDRMVLNGHSGFSNGKS